MNLGQVRNLKSIALPICYRNMLEIWVNNGGRSRDPPESFVDLRNQLIWGNQFIRHNNKCLFYQHRINTNILYINDLLNQNGAIDVNIILERLTKNHNWISEFNILKMSIPNQCKRPLKSEDSINTRIKIGTDFILKYKHQ